jgi:hypothetical protein
MKRQTFIVRDERVRANLMAAVAELRTAEPMEVTVKPYRKSRSLEQNNLLWQIYTIVAAETGHSPEDIHDWCRQQFLPAKFVEIDGQAHEVRRSTASLKVDEMTEYLNRVMAWATVDLGVALPAHERAA